MTYIDQLQALLEKYSQVELGDLLGITDRTIQNYFDDEKPTKPHQKTIRNIAELYTKVIVNGEKVTPGTGDVNINGFEPAILNEKSATYISKRRTQKATPAIHTAPLIPVKAQAGYVRAVDQSIYIDTLEQYALPPGVDPYGAVWAYWEIEGDSMEPVFNNKDIILTSQVPRMDWEQMRNFYIYVIVTHERILFKRVYCKNALEWVLISENEDHYPQQLLAVEYIKQVWVYRKTIKTDAAPTKEFIITV